jgi:hypothetical protein
VTLNGSTHYLCSGATGTCADSANFDTTTNSLTVGAWVKRSATGSKQDTVLAKEGNAAGDKAFNLNIDSSNIPAFKINSTTVNGGSNVVADFNWHYLVGVFDNTNNTQQIYMDGILVGSAALAGDSNNSGVALTIGADLSGVANAAANFFRGSIDEPFVTASALSAGQIRHMYTVGLHAVQNHTASRIQE